MRERKRKNQKWKHGRIGLGSLSLSLFLPASCFSFKVKRLAVCELLSFGRRAKRDKMFGLRVCASHVKNFV